MKELFQNVFFKMGMITILILLLLIPAFMVEGLIKERMFRQLEAKQEVSSKHAEGQKIVGPVLTVPFITTRNVTQKDGTVKQYKDREYFHILPNSLKIDGKIDPEIRKRGIYEVVLYGSDLKFNADFGKINFNGTGIRQEQFELDQAFVTVGITDLKGIRDQVEMRWNDQKVQFNPGVNNKDIVRSGLSVPIKLDSLGQGIKLSFDLHLNGSEELSFSPIGKETVVNMTSSWSEPSFDGSFLPAQREVSKDGFSAKWKILHLNRNFPQQWVGRDHRPEDVLFGVNLKVPVDVYQKTMRVAKYAVLFIVLTYLIFFFVEVLNKVLIHPIQYILVGIALILFYVLLLAFSEQIFFNAAYLVSAIMTIGLIFLYCRSLLGSWALAAMTSVILVILYAFIFIIIQMQDYALLFGSIGIFMILAVTMYFSRKIDWFDLKKSQPE